MQACVEIFVYTVTVCVFVCVYMRIICPSECSKVYVSKRDTHTHTHINRMQKVVRAFKRGYG